MPCERFGSALTGLAATGQAGPELEEHLASCEHCRGELASLRQALAAADEELSRIAAATPSPQLRARIRAAVAAEPEPAEKSFRWLWASAGAAAAVVLAVLWLARPPNEKHVAGGTKPAADHSRGESRGGATETPRAPKPIAPPSTAAAAGVVETAAVVSPADSRDGQSRTVGSAEVLVPRGEQEALLRLVALVHGERLASAVLEAVERPRADLPEPPGIDIAPLGIVPLDPEESSEHSEQGETP